MRMLIVLSAVALAYVALADDKTWSRTVNADVLRDFPGLCFASTKCLTYEPGKTWDLGLFCGRSTCVKGDGDKLLEKIEECKIPKENPKCKLNEKKTNLTAPFPACCPVIDCEAGVKLEYPDAPPVPVTVKPKKA